MNPGTPLLLGLALLIPLRLTAQNEGDIEHGKAVFRSNCAFCHGLTAKGGRGPSLISADLLHGSSDEQIKGIIRNGVPGTTMPAFDSMDQDDLEALVKYIRNLAGSNVSNTPVPGNAALGRKVYDSNGCSACHRIGNEGHVYGPELARIGAGRSTEYLRESIVNPSADIPQEYEGVSIVTKDGKRLTGVRVNEDTFSVQIRTPDGKFANFDKDHLQSVSYPGKSLMPAYNLSADDLQNLLAYLDSLRGSLNAATDATKAKGIH